MTKTGGKFSARSALSLVIASTFVVGVSLGALAVVVVQSIEPQNERTTHKIFQSEYQSHTSKNADSELTSGTTETELFLDFFEHRSIAEQYKALYTTLALATEEELKQWWVQSQKIPRESHREIAQHAILRNLTAINPQEALRCIEDVSKFQIDVMLTSVFSEWSVLQLDDAIEAASLLPGSQRRVALQALLKTRDDLVERDRLSIAQKLEDEKAYLKFISDAKASENIADPEQSWDTLLNDHVDDSLQLESLVVVAKAWHEHVGFEVLSSITADVRDYWVQRRVMEAIVQFDPAGALNYTLGLLDESEQAQLSSLVVREWASTNAQAALSFANSIEQSSMASILEREIASVWAGTRPREAIKNIETISEEVRLATLETAFARIARQDALEAIGMLSSVENYVGNTSTIAQRIVNHWSVQNPDAAVDWVLRNYSKDDPHRRSLLEYVLPRLALHDPDQAFELAKEQPSPDQGYGLEHYVIRALTYEGDIERAKKLLPRVSENSKLLAYSEVGRAMVRRSQIDQAMELGKEFAAIKRRIYYQDVLSQWSRSDPKNLYEALENLPTSELKSFAATQLIHWNKYEPVFTDEQIEHAKTFVSSDE